MNPSDPDPSESPRISRGHDSCRPGTDAIVRQWPRFSRRSLLLAGGGAFTAAITAELIDGRRNRHGRARVLVSRVDSYGPHLVDLVLRGLRELGLSKEAVRGKSVLLKPNLNEPTMGAAHINTHPEFIRAVAEAFRKLDSREVVVAEGQGHCRDTDFVLEQSGLERVLEDDRIPFVDLNYDDVYSVENRDGFSRLSKLFLPTSLRRADIIVSLPKMKTHHWAGVTLSMKNLFGVLPGICYGWPKNVLHHAGIGPCILDVCAHVRPHIAIVDGIVGMEGDGPIAGSAKESRLIAMGTSLPAVDATCARLMGFNPLDIDYLRNAGGSNVAIQEQNIEQCGEALAPNVQFFSLPDHPHFKQFRPANRPVYPTRQ